MHAWFEDEMAGVDLGDVRLNERGSKVLASLFGKPSQTIPTACGGWAETLAAYRLFDNESVVNQTRSTN